ncbi:MAG TPA: FAD-dependent oxidoreductase [Planctomycetota bacterium]|nr:FAD-dependent oxidoreductase [Planctomycetota bacterium]
MSERFEIAIVGAGLAGASVAYHLARAGARGIAVFEREGLPGLHSSGRNAALVRQSVEDEVNLRLAVEGARFFEDPPPDFEPRPSFRRTGSLLLASDAMGLERLDRVAAAALRNRLEVRRVGAAECFRRVPLLAGGPIAGGLLCPSDGVIDVHALLQAFLRGATARGVRFLPSCRVEEILVEGGAVARLATSAGEFEVGLVVNAAGAWAGALGSAVAAAIPFRPARRHLFVTEPIPAVDPDGPFVWDLSGPFYFRPESAGLLVCPCDEGDAPGCEETVDPRVEEEAAAGTARLLPSLAGRSFAKRWAGSRTLTPDQRFAIGGDPRVRGLFWVGGLGGHGVTCSPAVGRIAADLILRGRSDFADAALLDPSRFS